MALLLQDTNSEDPDIPRGHVLCWLCLILLAGFALRVWHLDHESLWIDEAFSVWVGWQPVVPALNWLARIDQHPPLYYLLLHFWMRIGDDPYSVRLLSALVSTLNVPVLYRLARRLAGWRVGLLAATLLAFSPFHVQFAQEARMYALLCLEATFLVWAVVVLLRDGRASVLLPGAQFRAAYRALLRVGRVSLQKRVRQGPRDLQIDLAWCGVLLASAAALWTHNTAVLLVLAVNVVVLGVGLSSWWADRVRRDRGLFTRPAHLHCICSAVQVSAARCRGARTTMDRALSEIPARGPARTTVGRFLRHWLLAQVGVLLLWSPWLPRFVTQSQAVYRSFWLPAPTAQVVLETVQRLLCAFLPDRLGWAWAVWVGYGLLLLLGAYRLQKRPGTLYALLVLFCVPIVGEWLISLLRPVFYDRTLIWASIPLYVLLALGLRQLRYRSWATVVTVALVTLNLLSIRNYDLHVHKEGWDEAAAYVAAESIQGDLILFHATWVQLPFDYYFREADLPVEERGVPVDLFDRGVLEPEMTLADVDRMRALIGGRGRVWLVYSHYWYTDPQRLVIGTLEKEMVLQSRRRFRGLEVRLYK